MDQVGRRDRRAAASYRTASQTLIPEPDGRLVRNGDALPLLPRLIVVQHSGRISFLRTASYRGRQAASHRACAVEARLPIPLERTDRSEMR